MRQYIRAHAAAWRRAYDTVTKMVLGGLLQAGLAVVNLAAPCTSLRSWRPCDIVLQWHPLHASTLKGRTGSLLTVSTISKVAVIHLNQP
jgi:hypothetical protein